MYECFVVNVCVAEDARTNQRRLGIALNRKVGFYEYDFAA